MAITETEFKNAFREVVSSEFSHIPTDENSIDYVFSKRFEKRMEKLIKSQKKAYWGLINTASKRAAIIVLAILTMFTTAFSVKAIREPIVKFMTEIYETFTHYFFEGDTAKAITKEYVISQIPAGFDEKNKIENKNSITRVYESNSGDSIIFSQYTTKYSIGYLLDNENNKTYTEKISDTEIVFYEAYDTIQALWVKDGYAFNITGYGNIDFDMIKQIIKSIK